MNPIELTSRRKSKVRRIVFQVVAVLHFCAFSAILFQCKGQAFEKPRFRRLTSNNGLSQNTVYTIHEDKSGFMWFGTQYGLSRFDGKEFRVFHQNKRLPNWIGGSVVYCIADAPNGHMIIGTDNGTYLFNPILERFYELDTVHIPLSLLLVQENELWLGTEKGLAILKRPPPLSLGSKYPQVDTFLTSYRINSILKGTNDTVWLATNKGLRYMLGSTRALGAGTSFIGNNIDCILQSKDHSHFVSFSQTDQTRNTTYHVSGSLLTPQINNTYNGQSTQTTCLLQDREKNLWIGTKGEGIIVLSCTLKETLRLTKTETDGLEENRIMALFEDRQGSIWVGTFSEGVAHFDPNQQRFKIYRGGLAQDPLVWSIHPSNLGTKLWIGTNSSFYSFDLDTKKFETPVSLPEDNIQRAVQCIFQEPDGDLWIGTSNGLFLYSNGVRYEKTPTKHSKGIANANSVMEILENPIEKNIWVATRRLGLFCIDPRTNQVTRNPQQLPEDTQIYSMLIDSFSRKVWLGTYGDGLLYFDLTGTSASPYYPIHNHAQSTCDNKSCTINKTIVLSMTTCLKDGTILAGTSGEGLIKIDGQSGQIIETYSSEQEGLASNIVYGTLPVDSSKILISTHKGITEFDLLTRKVLRNFDMSSWLGGSELIAKAAYFNMSNNKYYFGGVHGLVVLDGNQLSRETRYPELLFSGVMIKNEPYLGDTLSIGGDLRIGQYSYKQDSAIQYLKSIEVPYGLRPITIKLSALEYNNREDIYFRAKLINEATSDTITLLDSSKISELVMSFSFFDQWATPDSYKLIAWCTNRDGVWNPEYEQLRIRVSLPTILKPGLGGYSIIFGLFLLASIILTSRIRRYNFEKKVEHRTKSIKSLHSTILSTYRGTSTNELLDAQIADMSKLFSFSLCYVAMLDPISWKTTIRYEKNSPISNSDVSLQTNSSGTYDVKLNSILIQDVRVQFGTDSETALVPILARVNYARQETLAGIQFEEHGTALIDDPANLTFDRILGFLELAPTNAPRDWINEQERYDLEVYLNSWVIPYFQNYELELESKFDDQISELENETEPEKILHSGLAFVVEMLGIQKSDVSILDLGSMVPKILATTGIDKSLLHAVREENSRSANPRKGIFLMAYETNKIIIENDVEDSKLYIKGIPEVRSQMSIPISIGLTSTIVNLYSNQKHFFDKYKGIKVAVFFRRVLSTYFRILDDEQIRLYAMRKASLDKILSIIINRLSLADNLGYILDEVAREVQCRFGYVATMPKDTGLIQLVKSKGLLARNIPHLEIGIDGLAGVVFQTKKLYNWPAGIVEDNLYVPYQDIQVKICSELVVPLVFENVVIGLLTLSSEEQNHFTQSDIEYVTAVATQASSIIQRQKFDIATEKLAKIMFDRLEEDDICRTIAAEAVSILEAAAAEVWLVEEIDKGSVKLRYECCEGLPREAPTPAARIKALNLQILKTAEPFILGNGSVPFACTEYPPSSIADFNEAIGRPEEIGDFRSSLLAPITDGKSIFGVIVLYCKRPSPFFEKEKSLLQTLVGRAASALISAKFQKQATEERRRLDENQKLLEENHKLLEENQRIIEESQIKLEEKQQLLLRTAHIASPGLTALSFAHDIKHSLTKLDNEISLISILLSNQGKLPKEELDRQLENHFSAASSHSEFLRKLIRSLTSQTKDINVRFKLEKIKDVISSTIFLFEHRLTKSQIECHIEYSNNDISLECSTDQLQQVFLNLLQNSIDALEKVTHRKRIIRISVKENLEGNSVEIIFRDNGSGIQKGDVSQIFDILFTTKGIAGSGIGLSICKRIIEDYHRGSIRVKSIPDKFTIFFITLPKIHKK